MCETRVHDGIDSAAVPLPHRPEFGLPCAGKSIDISSLLLDWNAEHSPRMLTCDIPNLHGDVTLPDITQIKRNGWNNILRPLDEMKSNHKSV